MISILIWFSYLSWGLKIIHNLECGYNDAEMKASIQGIARQMKAFWFLFGLPLSDIIIGHIDMLSKTLQSPELSGIEGNEIASLTIQTLQRLRSELNFKLFWDMLDIKSVEWKLKSKNYQGYERQAPKRYENGDAGQRLYDNSEDMYEQTYFEALEGMGIQTFRDKTFRDGTFRDRHFVTRLFVTETFRDKTVRDRDISWRDFSWQRLFVTRLFVTRLFVTRLVYFLLYTGNNFILCCCCDYWINRLLQFSISR